MSPEGARARLFVAVWPPDEVLDRLAALDRPDVAGVRWTRRDQWHITLRFLGPVDLGEAVDAFAHVSAPVAEATLGPGIERFTPSVLAVPVAGLDRAASAVVAAMGEIGKPEPARPFHGHLTLARARGRGRIDPRSVPACSIEARWPVEGVHLVRSDLHPHGARYEIVASRALEA